jgi:hypothetical protein
MTKTFVAFAALLGALIGPAHAAGEDAAVKDTTVSSFSDADDALLKARVDEALMTEKDGQTLEWKNDKRLAGRVALFAHGARNTSASS